MPPPSSVPPYDSPALCPRCASYQTRTLEHTDRHAPHVVYIRCEKCGHVFIKTRDTRR